jgi:hypothetical protein
MPYTAEISRTNPTCLLFLVDQSGSMRLPFGREQSIRKADGVSDAINRLLYGFVLRSTSGDHVLDRYYIGVFGYGKRIGSALGGELAGQGLVPVSAIATKPLRLETRVKKVPDGAGGLVEAQTKFPIWLDPVADSPTTPMCEALREAKKTIESFIGSCPKAFPPIVINITDGAATDGDPEPLAAELRGLTTEDGNVLLFNVHISSKELPPIELPVSENELPDKQARLLYRMSSPLPEKMIAEARSLEQKVPDGARGFVFNADLVSVIQFLDIGTRTGNQ